MIRKPGPCNARGCPNPFTRLYPAGWRCEKHRPGASDETPERNTA